MMLLVLLLGMASLRKRPQSKIWVCCYKQRIIGLALGLQLRQLELAAGRRQQRLSDLIDAPRRVRRTDVFDQHQFDRSGIRLGSQLEQTQILQRAPPRTLLGNQAIISLP